MANNLTVTYKGSTIHTASASGSATLETGGTWCEDDIGLSYEFDEAIATLAVTVTNGTATSVTATKSGVSVSLTYSGGIWSAELPSFGTWTITITDGTHSNSATVNASTAGLYSVSIFMPDVPSGYTQLEYLESAGEQYISCGLIANNDYDYVIEFQISSSALSVNRNYVIGTNPSKGRTQFSYSAIPVYAWGNAIDNTSTLALTTGRHSVRINKTAFALDGTVLYTPTSSDFSGAAYAPYFFALNNSGIANNISSGVRIISALISNITTGTTLRKFYPARRNSDGELGLYDTVNNVFYTNDGTGTFIAGPAV